MKKPPLSLDGLHVPHIRRIEKLTFNSPESEGYPALWSAVSRLIRDKAERPDSHDTPYDNLHRLLNGYIGEADPSKRVGYHLLPGVERQTRRGDRVYSLGVAAKFNPLTSELCVIRKDPCVDNNDTTDWLVLRHSILSGETKEDHVIGVHTTYPEHAATGDHIVLDLAPDKEGIGSYQLSFSVNHNYQINESEKIRLSHWAYYGRCEITDMTYGMDVQELFDALRQETEPMHDVGKIALAA